MMKNKFKNLLLLGVTMNISFQGALAEDVKVSQVAQSKNAELTRTSVSVKEESGLLVLQNANAEIKIDLKSGRYSGKDKRTDTVIFKDASFGIDETTGSARWKPESLKITWTKKDDVDEFGKGTTVYVMHTPGPGYDPIKIQTIRLYQEHEFVVFGWGIKNQFKYPVRIKHAEVITMGGLFNGQTVENPRVLRSGAGREANLVEKNWKMSAHNGVMLTYEDKGIRRSLVAGGLKYNEFGRWVEIQEDKRKFKYLSMKCWDPQGKQIEGGKTYYSPDTCYLDFSTSDPFVALEKYGMALRKANNAKPNNYDFPTLCGWMVSTTHLGEGLPINNSPGMVNQLELAKKRGLLKYTPLAVRLEPDFYCAGDQGNSQQGWWDDKHWQKYGPGGIRGPVSKDEIGTGKGSLQKPYETFAKFCGAVSDLGGKTFTYFQANMPSHDFARQHPEWMLNNDISQLHVAHRHSSPLVKFDFTDPGFRDYTLKMWTRLGKDGLDGVKFDYPETAWITTGGFEDKTFTSTSAYREMYDLCRQGLGEDAFIHERIMGAPRQDTTAGLVDLQRVWGDASHFEPEMASRIGLRWYKSRSVYLYYPDGKSFFSHGKPIPTYKRRSFLTLIAFLSGRLEIGSSFSQMTDEMIHDVTRLYPMIRGTRSPRPVDMLLGKKHPEIYDYQVTEGWNQVLLVNNDKDGEKAIKTPLAGSQVKTGSLGLDENASYHVFDFWSQKYVGKLKGSEHLESKLRGGEVAMLSVRKVSAHPQMLSTNRHFMQGMMDTKNVTWDNKKKTLSGQANVVEGEDFVLTVACNGSKVVSCDGATIKKHEGNMDLIDLVFTSDKTKAMPFKLRCK
ncbi:hypothetical protein [Oceaniferula marina]|nr:hypothetical protein [Oceaniferula marina]